jgi:DnaJ-class molecular chaperone
MNYYNVLNVNENASKSEIKSAYRKLSMKYHPDKGGDAEKFKQINEAYQNLGDERKRKVYDMQRKNPFSNNMNNINVNGGMDDIFKMFFNGNDPFNGGGIFNNGNFGGPTVKIFHNGRPVNINRQMSKPTPIMKTITISLEEAYNGKNYALEIERWVLNENIKKTEKENIYVTIPKGIDNNEIIFIRNKGNIINENNKGDIKIFIKIKNYSVFTRNGLDLCIKKNISLKQALTGFSFDLDYFNGKKFAINNDGDFIVTPGYKKYIKGLGMVREKNVGDLVIEFEIEFPKSFSKNQIKVLKTIL